MNLINEVKAWFTDIPSGFQWLRTLARIVKSDGSDLSPTNPLEVGIFDGRTGARVLVGANGSLKVGEPSWLVGDAFGMAALSPSLWSQAAVGSGALNVEAGQISLITGVTLNSSMKLQSAKLAQFRPGSFNVFHAGAQLGDLGVTNNTRTFGAYSPLSAEINGVFFTLVGTEFKVGYVKAGVRTEINQSQFNGPQKDNFIFNTDLQAYEIQYNAGVIEWFQGPNLIHIASVFSTTYAEIYHFKIGVENININGHDGNHSISFRALGIYRLGRPKGTLISRVFPNGVNLVKEGPGYADSVTIARSGSAGGSATLDVYDSIAGTEIHMGNMVIGGNSTETLALKSHFSNGLRIVSSGSGTINLTARFE